MIVRKADLDRPCSVQVDQAKGHVADVNTSIIALLRLLLSSISGYGQFAAKSRNSHVPSNLGAQLNPCLTFSRISGRRTMEVTPSY